MYKVSFKFTFDGNKEQHNSVRFSQTKNVENANCCQPVKDSALKLRLKMEIL